jgi:hypothetical protein
MNKRHDDAHDDFSWTRARFAEGQRRRLHASPLPCAEGLLLAELLGRLGERLGFVSLVSCVTSLVFTETRHKRHAERPMTGEVSGLTTC